MIGKRDHVVLQVHVVHVSPGKMALNGGGSEAGEMPDGEGSPCQA